jgi:hypothetical protein
MFLIIVGFVIGLIIAGAIAFISDFKQIGAAIAAGADSKTLMNISK